MKLETAEMDSLSIFEILRLVGFAAGAALHLYLCGMLIKRYGIRRSERLLLSLGFVVGVWHLGNFAASIYELIAFHGMQWWPKSAYIVAYTSVSFLPPLLFASHVRVWRLFDKNIPAIINRLIGIVSAIGFLPLALLPEVFRRLLEDSHRDPLVVLSPFLIPYTLWFVLIFIECALIDWRLANITDKPREKSFFKVFGATLIVIGVLFFSVYITDIGRGNVIGQYLDLLARLSSIVPTTIIAYYIYRYHYLELVIRRSFVYAISAAIIMSVYIFGVRRLSQFLETTYGARASVIEALSILVIILLAGPLRRAIEYATAVENRKLMEEKKQLERALADRERLAALGQMAATVAHEVKNPLSAIKSISQVMREDDGIGKEYSRDLDLIIGEVDRLNGTVSQLLNFSRTTPLNIESHSSSILSELLDSILAVTAPEREKIEASISVDTAFDPLISGANHSRFKEILLNLILNALQAIKRQGEVKIESKPYDGDGLYLSITDNGSGIPSHLIDKIFEPFFTTKQRGTGLGLAIVGKHVREMDGRITVISPIENGVGTKFEITIHSFLPQRGKI